MLVEKSNALLQVKPRQVHPKDGGVPCGSEEKALRRLVFLISECQVGNFATG